MAKCASCGSTISLSEVSIRCKHCGGTLCSDCAGTATKSNRCPVCGESFPG